jgi:hypothetical protein
MSKPYDAVPKELVEVSPESWPTLLGLPSGPTSVINADVSTVTVGADKVLRISGRSPWVLLLEFQSGPDQSLPRRTHAYNAVLENRHRLPVVSALVLLSPKANLRSLTGVYERSVGGETYLTFRYRVLRVWETPAQLFLEGGPGLLPLAPVSAVSDEEVPGVLRQVKERLRGHVRGGLAAQLWSASLILLGLRFPETLIGPLLEESMNLEDSSTYRLLRARFKAEEARSILLRLARRRLGTPPEGAEEAVNAVSDLKRLEELAEEVFDMNDWSDLLRRLAPRRTRQRRQNGAGT